MRIVHVASSLVRKSAGVREVILELSREQLAQGIDVAVLGLDHPDWANEKGDWDGIPTTVLSVNGPRPLGYAPSMTGRLHEIAPDLVHLHGLWMHPGRSVLQWHRSSSRPFVISPHGMLSETALSYGRQKKRVVSLWFQDAVFQHAATIHATCDSEADEIREYGIRAPVCIVPNGIAEIKRPKISIPASKTILSLGRIHRKKALDQLILAWSSLEADFPEWSVQIVGPDEGGETERLFTLISKIGVKRVSIHDPVYGAEKSELMAKAGLFALPTHSENFALTVAESLMLGVPVVSSKGAPWSGLETERCGRWVPYGAGPMAEALRGLMELSVLERRAMGERGRNWMLREFNWPIIAERFSQCYARSAGNLPIFKGIHL